VWQCGGVAVDRVIEFLERAHHCREAADRADTPEVKRHYEELAAMWERMARERLLPGLEESAKKAASNDNAR